MALDAICVALGDGPPTCIEGWMLALSVFVELMIYVVGFFVGSRLLIAVREKRAKKRKTRWPPR